MSDDPRFHPPTLRAHLAAAREAGNFREQARLLLILANLADNDHETEFARALYAQSSVVAETCQAYEQQAVALRFLAHSLSMTGNDMNQWRTACLYYEDAIVLYGRAGKVSDQVRLYMDVSFLRLRLGEPEKDTQLYESAFQALEAREIWDDPENIYWILKSIVEDEYPAPHLEHLHDRALQLYERAEALCNRSSQNKSDLTCRGDS